jgi:DNA-directed RNA polymerase specialized sigma24 family protein
VEGYSIGEVAKMVGVPVPTAKSRIWFARRELRKKARRDPYLGQLLEEIDTNDEE